MANQAAITVFDGATTPVSHTLQPVDNKVLPDGTRYSLWRENVTSLPREAQVFLEIWQKELKPSRVVETRSRVSVPVMESVSGVNASGYTAAPKVAYIDPFEWKSYSHPRSSSASKKLAAQLSRNLINNVATSVPAVAAGVIHDAHVDGYMPT